MDVTEVEGGGVWAASESIFSWMKEKEKTQNEYVCDSVGMGMLCGIG